jgi:hypothetical protein
VDGEWTPAEVKLFRADTNGKSFYAVVIQHETESELTPIKTIGVALIDADNCRGKRG